MTMLGGITMRRLSNPFTPTFGRVPYALAGRDELIDDVMEGLANQPGDPNRSTIFIGPRGSGKTVLLRSISQEASRMGWVCVSVSARKGMLDKIVGRAHVNAHHLLVEQSKSSVSSIQVGPVALGREVKREEVPWWLDIQNMVEQLNEQGIGLLVTIDEIDPTCEELIDFIDTYQHFVSEERDVALLMAGLPGQVSALLQDKNVSFIRRAFQRHLRPIDRYDVEEAIYETLASKGKAIDNDALAVAVEAAHGLAFAVQLVGYYLWRVCGADETIDVRDAEEAASISRRELVNSIVEPTLSELTQRELEYVTAMAQDAGPSSTSDVAARMGISMTNASNLRRRLITYGIIVDRRMGVVDFELPLMREYLRGEVTPR